MCGYSDHLPLLCHLNSLSNFEIYFTDPKFVPDSSLANLSKCTRAFPPGYFAVNFITLYEKLLTLVEVDDRLCLQSMYRQGCRSPHYLDRVVQARGCPICLHYRVCGSVCHLSLGGLGDGQGQEKREGCG
jgi:hypothetical protein